MCCANGFTGSNSGVNSVLKVVPLGSDPNGTYLGGFIIDVETMKDRGQLSWIFRTRKKGIRHDYDPSRAR